MLRNKKSLTSVKKVKIILLISVICWVLLALFIALLLVATKFKVTDKPGMAGKNYEDVVAFSYNSSGDMRGSEIDISLKTQGENVMITYFTRESHNDEGVTKTVNAPVSALEEINALFHRCGVQDMGKLKKSDIIELDGATIDIEFITAQNRYRIFSNDKIPEKAENIIPESYKILMRYYENP